jgi:4-aminobutyrate aminotransferase
VGAVCNRDLLTVSRRQKYEGFHPKPGRRIHCRYSEIEIFPAFKGLQDMAERQPLIGDVRGRGLAIGIELVKNKGSREPTPVETAKVVYRAYELGVIVYYVGLFSNVLELTPPLILNRKEAEEALQILEQAISDVEQGCVPDEKIKNFKGW